MKFTFGKSISVRFIAIILLVLTVGQGIGVYLFLTSIRGGFMEALHARMKREVKQYASVLAEPVVNYNTAFIDSFITESLKDQDIQAIRVLDKSGKPIKEHVVQRGNRRLFVLTEPIVIFGDNVGAVKLEYTAKTLDDSMKSSALLIPIYQLGMLLVVALVLIRLFNSFVKSPVKNLNQAIDGITGGDLSTEVPIHRDDEIGTIANGVKFLAERLSGTVSRINSNSDKVTGAVQQLNDTFDRVRHVIDSQNHSTEDVSIAVKNAADSQLGIVSSTEQLLSLSGDNLSALLQMQSNSEEIAETTDNLNKNVQDSYSALAELAQTAKVVAHTTDEVSSFVAAASTSVEEVFRSVKNVEEQISETARLTILTTTIISEKGMVAISDVTNGMQRIGTFIDSLMATIEKLGNRSRDIGNVISVIEEVTARSRLLSLNAQIIAAQAGESGKGFAVVAGEMKDLSDKSALSTKEIDNIIGVIQQEIEQAVSAARESVSVVREGEAVANRTSNVLSEILETSLQATELAKGIERASLEQTDGLKAVVNSTEQIRDKISEVNRATTEQEKGTAFLLNALNPIKEGMGFTKRGTEEQATSTRLIIGNIELANRKISDISTASSNQQLLNQRVLDALEAVINMGGTTVKEVDGLIPVVNVMLKDMEALRSEMEGFRTINERGRKSKAIEQT